MLYSTHHLEFALGGKSMKSREKIDTERFSKALAILRQDVETVLKDAPNLMEINRLEEIPGENSKFIEEQLWRILLYGEYYVEKVKSDLNVPLLTVKSRGKNYAFYENEYPNFIEKTRELIGASNIPAPEVFERDFEEYMYRHTGDFDIPEGDEYLDAYERYVQTGPAPDMARRRNKGTHADDPILVGNEKIRNSFAVAVKAVEYVAECHWFIEHRGSYPEDDYTRALLGFDCDHFDYVDPRPYERVIKNCNLVAEKSYFQPDAWLANEQAISPVIVVRDLEKIPRHIKERIGEINQSFVFSNWMSSIALSRCLLEYALIDRKSLFEKRLNRKIDIRVNKMRAKPIGELVEVASDAFPELEEGMGVVVEYGHNVMHPFRRVIPSRNQAKQCVEEITKIIGALYSAK